MSKKKSSLAYLVSNFDIEAAFKHDDINIITYSELKDYTSITQLLPTNKCACFILIRTSNQSGHWTVITRYNNTISYFDSYGIKPDGELKNIPNSQRYELGEDQHYLINLLKDTQFKITYNTHDLQSRDENINTCGKWCVAFTKAIFEGLTVDDFYDGIQYIRSVYLKEHPNDTKELNDKIVSVLFKTYV
jgi:hypothetical protein